MDTLTKDLDPTRTEIIFTWLGLDRAIDKIRFSTKKCQQFLYFTKKIWCEVHYTNIQGSYRQGLVTFKYFSRTVWPLSRTINLQIFYLFMLVSLPEKYNRYFNKGDNTNRSVQTFATSDFILRSYTKIWNIKRKSLDIYFKSPILVVQWKTRSQLAENIEIQVQSTLVISTSKGLSEILRAIRTSTYQICRFEQKLIRLTSFNKYMCNLTPLS